MSTETAMATARQELGRFGEARVTDECACPCCKRSSKLVRLPANFKCADVICDFCGYLAQIKTSRVRDIDVIPDTILGAAWKPQRERIAAAIYFPLFLVLKDGKVGHYAIYYLSADLQDPQMFRERLPLSEGAKRAGWQGFSYDLRLIKDRFVRLR
jgi:Dam-replacing family